MRILFISCWFPYPANNGSKIRILHLLRELSKRHAITLLSFAEPNEASEDDQEALSAICRRVRVAPRIHFDPRRARALMGFLSPTPRSLVDIHSPLMAQLVRDEMAGNPYDLVIASELSAIPYALQLDGPALPGPPAVARQGQGAGPRQGSPALSKAEGPAKGTPRLLEDLELAVRREKFTTQVGPARRLRYGLSWWKTARYLRRVLCQFDACTVVSQEERLLLAQTVPNRPPVAVIPNGVDLAFNSGDFGPVEPGSLVYNGALTYRANFDAMVFFLSDVWPLVRAQCPNARLYITGRTAGVPLDKLPPSQGVVFTGYLDDVRPRVAQSQLVVIPLRVGAGTRLKILEALALGTPVVSTSKGAEGLDLQPGQDLLIADDPADFAQQTVRVLQDPALRARLVANGRRAVKRYDWPAIGSELNRFVEEVVGTR